MLRSTGLAYYVSGHQVPHLSGRSACARRLTIPCYLISYILSILHDRQGTHAPAQAYDTLLLNISHPFNPSERERGRRGGSVTPEEYGAEEEEHVAGGAAVLDREDAADDAEQDVGRVRVFVLRGGDGGGRGSGDGGCFFSSSCNFFLASFVRCRSVWRLTFALGTRVIKQSLVQHPVV